MHTTLAYLDPGSAGLVLQMIGGGLAAGAVALKLFWRRILRLLHIRRDEPQADAPSR
jgi:hypothetical protein